MYRRFISSPESIEVPFGVRLPPLAFLSFRRPWMQLSEKSRRINSTFRAKALILPELLRNFDWVTHYIIFHTISLNSQGTVPVLHCVTLQPYPQAPTQTRGFLARCTPYTFFCVELIWLCLFMQWLEKPEIWIGEFPRIYKAKYEQGSLEMADLAIQCK